MKNRTHLYPSQGELRIDLAHFRTTSHNLKVEIGRHNNISFEDRLGQLCGRSNIFVVGDEVQVVIHCEAYNDTKYVYIDKEIWNCANKCSFFH